MAEGTAALPSSPTNPFVITGLDPVILLDPLCPTDKGPRLKAGVT
jgi:hypothetical protein